MIDLDERNHIIELKFQLTVEWFEYRATYQNLKTNKALNVLSSQELIEIWIPYIIFKVYPISLLCEYVNSKVSNYILNPEY